MLGCRRLGELELALFLPPCSDGVAGCAGLDDETAKGGDPGPRCGQGNGMAGGAVGEFGDLVNLG